MKKELFGVKIRMLRKDKGMLLKDLAVKSGIELTYLSKIENDRTGIPEAGTIEKLAKALGVDEDAKQELFRLAKQIPPEWKEIIAAKEGLFEIFRSTKDFDEQQLRELIEDIKKRKKNA